MKITTNTLYHLLLTLSLFSLQISANSTLADEAMESVSVTGTREHKNKDALAESVQLLNEEIIQQISASHPSELINQTAGAHINNLGGEGHMTAIRQPITTRGVYLFLEDSIPIRPSGFFNHNALYEVNIPQSRQVEVIKGPGTALYGSEAIGGMINVLSRKPPEAFKNRLNAEIGSFGWKRLLMSTGGSAHQQGVNFSVNLTQSDGYQDASDYDRQSTSFRWDSHFDQVSTKTLFTYTGVNQSGMSPLSENDYLNNPEKNTYHGDTGFREVSAFRLSTEVDISLTENQALSVIPFYRHNTMTMSPAWMVTYDPNERDIKFQSYGLLTKYRWDITPAMQWLMGVDLDYTPSTFEETAVNHTKIDDIYTGFTPISTSYDYDAEQQTISPYLRLEAQWIENLILSFGLRYDYFAIDYKDNYTGEDSVFIDQLQRPVTHYRPEDQSLTFTQFSPKFGMVYQYADFHNLYLNYRHAFSTPSVTTLFRSGTTKNSDGLEPIKADSYEIGFRGELASWLDYELALYHMEITDDIVKVINEGERNSVNAGETEHQGIELTLKGDITDEFAYSVAYSHTKQTYQEFSYVCFSCEDKTFNASGYNVGKAPESIGNLSLLYTPTAIDGLSLSAEWAHLGPYYVDETNLEKYKGHDLWHLRAAYQINEMIAVYLRSQNITDERYSTYTSRSVGKDEATYRVGMPRTFTAGLRLAF